MPQACDATLEIAEMCEPSSFYGNAAPEDERFHVPRFEPPEGKDRDAYLRELVMQGAASATGADARDRRTDRAGARRDRVDGVLGLLPDRGT